MWAFSSISISRLRFNCTVRPLEDPPLSAPAVVTGPAAAAVTAGLGGTMGGLAIGVRDRADEESAGRAGRGRRGTTGPGPAATGRARDAVGEAIGRLSVDSASESTSRSRSDRGTVSMSSSSLPSPPPAGGGGCVEDDRDDASEDPPADADGVIGRSPDGVRVAPCVLMRRLAGRPPAGFGRRARDWGLTAELVVGGVGGSSGVEGLEDGVSEEGVAIVASSASSFTCPTWLIPSLRFLYGGWCPFALFPVCDN